MFSQSANILRISSRLRNNLTKCFARQIHTTDVSMGFKSRWHAPMRRSFFKRIQEMEKKGTLQVTPRNQYIEWNYNVELYAFGKRLNENFDDGLLREALVDESYLNKVKKEQEDHGLKEGLQIGSNSRLADIGAKLLLTHIPAFLRGTLQNLPEEGIQAITHYLTSTEILKTVACGIGLKFLIMCEEDFPSDEVLERSFMAVLGALAGSSGEERTALFIRDFVITNFVGKDIFDVWQVENAYAVLKQVAKRSGQEMEPRIIGKSATNSIFATYKVAIYNGEKFLLGTGFGETVDIAVDEASRDVLHRLFGTKFEHTSPLPISPHITEMPLKNSPNLSIKDLHLNNVALVNGSSQC